MLNYFSSARTLAVVLIGAVILLANGCTYVLAVEDTPNQVGPLEVNHIQGEIAGEVSTNGVILQSRLTVDYPQEDGNVTGAPGVAYFEIATQRDFSQAVRGRWHTAAAETDFIVKEKVTDLKSGTRYYYRLVYGPDRQSLARGQVRTFKTLPGSTARVPVSFVHSTCTNYRYFHHGGKMGRRGPYKGHDKALGYPAIAQIRQLAPDFWILNGDNVYYDTVTDDGNYDASTTIEEMRRDWHQQFAQSRFVESFAQIPTYWLKDDHDFRYNDADTTGNRAPTAELGIRIFREQVPVVDPEDDAEKTYRTYRVSRDLQLWFLEGRDFRDPNRREDGPEKSLWGKAQREWLKRTILDSDATIKIIVSPTPIIGPDRKTKSDNHTNPQGFRHEGTAFLKWADEHGLARELFFIVGDRHWQYHSINPQGFEEFSSGALSDVSAIPPMRPGAKQSTDPESEIIQPFTAPEPTGGFIHVTVGPLEESDEAEFVVRYIDEKGTEMYRVTRRHSR